MVYPASHLNGRARNLKPQMKLKIVRLHSVCALCGKLEGLPWIPGLRPPARRWVQPSVSRSSSQARVVSMACSLRRAAREGMRRSPLTRLLSATDHQAKSAIPLPRSHMHPLLHVSSPHDSRDPPGCSTEAPAPSPSPGEATPRAHPGHTQGARRAHLGGSMSSIPWSGAQEGVPAVAGLQRLHRNHDCSSKGSGRGVYPWSASPRMGRGLSSSSSCHFAASGGGAGGASVGTGAAGMGVPATLTGVHVFQCEDHLGIVSRISDCVASRGGNLTSIDLFVDLEAHPRPHFYSRCEFAFSPTAWSRDEMASDLASLGAQLGAIRSTSHVPGLDPPLRTAILASKQDHCLVDMLHRWQNGLLPIHISCVISNHERAANTHVMRFLERHGIPYHHVDAAGSADKGEGAILDLVGGSSTDFLVLARYMQVLSPQFLAAYGGDIINIHHGLLPSFKGAKPYLQAYHAGVKLIGATSHFVTPQLDEGPIIEQMVDRVSHRDTLASLAIKSKLVEQQCLSQAVQYYAEHRILRYSNNKTVVFAS